MIYGIGNDLLEISRMEKSMESERFMAFSFSAAERTLFSDKPVKLAGCFAAKEALSKALGTGVRGFSLDEISVLRDELGKPYFVFTGNISKIIESKSLTAHVALTNSKEYVVANVVLEERI